jgi:hypothetical protein
MFRTNEQRAVAYAVFKALETALKEDGDLPPGFSMDLSGQTFTMTLPGGTTVHRERGEKGDGMIGKKATQNLLSIGTMAFLVERLKRFNQASQVEACLREAWTWALENPQTKVEDRLPIYCPELNRIIEEFKSKGGPKREEKTPRKIQFPKHIAPTMSFQRRLAAEAA